MCLQADTPKIVISHRLVYHHYNSILNTMQQCDKIYSINSDCLQIDHNVCQMLNYSQMTPVNSNA